MNFASSGAIAALLTCIAFAALGLGMLAGRLLGRTSTIT